MNFAIICNTDAFLWVLFVFIDFSVLRRIFTEQHLVSDQSQ